MYISKGKTMNYFDVVVFGGSSGIGLATAISFKNKGYSVLSISRNSEKNNQLLQHGIVAKNIDIANHEAIDSLFTEIQTKHIILSTSMPLHFENISDLSIATAKQSFEKVWFYLDIIKQACKKSNNLEAITIISGAIAQNNVAGTLALKLMASALNEMSKTLAVELSPIRVNAVSPGITRTALYDQFDNKEQMLLEIANSTPLKRIANPDEIADAIMFVTLNNNVTGSIINIDGGATL